MAKKKKAKKSIRLTQAVSCAGCASKLDPAFLRQAVFNLKQAPNPRLLVGFDKADDAGIYQISNDMALVQTVDFFTPIVDDPASYGRIAATNALSDVYAMGGKPLTALNILCFPEELGTTILSQILKGALEKTNEAGCTLVGGHSVKDKELKFGMSVTGLINPGRVMSNDKALPGQILVLTKKLGTGIITTAAKNNACPETILKDAIDNMSTLNDKACDAMLASGATACTDMTGFSFLGHLSEMVRASKVHVRIESKDIPFYEGLPALIKEGFLTRADKTNRVYATGGKPSFINLKKISKTMQHILFDPQTSGGLLVGMPPEDLSAFKNRMESFGQEAWLVGEILEKSSHGKIEIIN